MNENNYDAEVIEINGSGNTVELRRKWMLGMAVKYLLVILILVTLMIVAGRVGQKKALVIYNQQLEICREEYEQELAAFNALPLSEDRRRQEEAEMIARVLYGVKSNSTDDFRTLCWCIFNRVQNPLYPNTVSEVINQPEQWMLYDRSNPVLESLYTVAREELDKWYDGAHRPCSDEFVFMSWEPSEISLRDEFNTTSHTRYWRIKQ